MALWKRAGHRPYDIVSGIMAYEEGDLDDEGTAELFQALIDSGTIRHLQGHYQRAAADMLAAGVIHYPADRVTDNDETERRRADARAGRDLDITDTNEATRERRRKDK